VTNAILITSRRSDNRIFITPPCPTVTFAISHLLALPQEGGTEVTVVNPFASALALTLALILIPLQIEIEEFMFM
jgi:hypothetical protein